MKRKDHSTHFHSYLSASIKFFIFTLTSWSESYLVCTLQVKNRCFLNLTLPLHDCNTLSQPFIKKHPDASQPLPPNACRKWTAAQASTIKEGTQRTIRLHHKEFSCLPAVPSSRFRALELNQLERWKWPRTTKWSESSFTECTKCYHEVT